MLSVYGRISEMAPNGARRICFLRIQTLSTFWAERISILIFFFIFLDLFDFKFTDFQVPRFPGHQISKFPDFQVPRFPRFPDFRKIGPYSSGDHFPESCAPRKMMQNRMDEILWGRSFKGCMFSIFSVHGKNGFRWPQIGPGGFFSY